MVFFQARNALKTVFGRGFAPDPTGGAYDAPPESLVGWEGGSPSHSPPLLLPKRLGPRHHLRRLVQRIPTSIFSSTPLDGMHATIDYHLKKLEISAPSEWSVVLQTARRGHPYVVREMEQHEFFAYTV